ncbi:unnamed protein product [Somion occarium]|uniref:Uncharacterized protein n=1 Tax=Somion occarium TaxID=3059160 RepID=A0ABP1CYE3_9APHY
MVRDIYCGPRSLSGNLGRDAFISFPFTQSVVDVKNPRSIEDMRSGRSRCSIYPVQSCRKRHRHRKCCIYNEFCVVSRELYTTEGRHHKVRYESI